MVDDKKNYHLFSIGTCSYFGITLVEGKIKSISRVISSFNSSFSAIVFFKLFGFGTVMSIRHPVLCIRYLQLYIWYIEKNCPAGENGTIKI